MQTRHVYFGGFQHELGEKHPVEALPQLREQPELRAHILNGGFRHYRKSAHGPAELAYRCVRKLLDARPELRDDIDLVIYATLTLKDPDCYNGLLGEVLVRLGLEKVNVTGVFSSECGNMVAALQLAQGMIESGKARQVLVIATDTCLDEGQRVIDGNVVVSDGAACFVVNTDPDNDFRLLDSLQRSDQRLRMEASAAYSPKFLKLSTDAMKECVETLLRSRAIAREKIDVFLTGNFARSALAMFSYVAGVKREIHFCPDVADVAHAYACDISLNLERLLAEQRLMPGNLVLCLATGKSNWFTSAFVKT
ncbi:beta-ketoacyl-ACP synthase [Ralstonia pseudosolanacearum]|uniref:beta-ketoacyl-ACP synthase n=1 Tax=Ralstonia pseudosolanacearum TaxID=1310165 RepID=UPI003C1AB4BE